MKEVFCVDFMVGAARIDIVSYRIKPGRAINKKWCNGITRQKIIA